MPTVVVAGAGGLIGGSVAAAFARSGWRVLGLIRKQNQSTRLLRNEILPVLIEDLNKPETYLEQLKQASVVVDASGATSALVDAVLKLNESQPATTYHKILIVTSGTGINASTVKPPRAVEDSHRADPVHQFLEAARQVTDKVLSHGGNVVEPSIVYGGSGVFKTVKGYGPSHQERWFNHDPTADLVIFGKEGVRFGFIHVEDLANVYLLIAQKGVKG